jgi:hypothetical protein
MRFSRSQLLGALLLLAFLWALLLLRYAFPRA